MKTRITLTALLFTIIVSSQNYLKINQTNVAIQQNNISYSNNNFGLKIIASEIAAFRNSWENQKKKGEYVAKAQSQLSMIKKAYKDSKSYPTEIIDGWHLIIATDNYNYCSPAKVLIENNSIKEFVVNNWTKLSRPFTTLSTIKKGKAMISLDFDGNTDTVEIYFINDLQEPTIVKKPLESAYISFWSDWKKAESIKIYLDEKYYGDLSKRFKDLKPLCFDLGTITIEVKPGNHFFKAFGRGSISWEGYIEAKEGLCFQNNLNKENKK
ncbi:hypothetical protein FF125_14220 [Aureibaculum algae]|uniref:Uncharacterized protein n=1 Tax=Aureibaculum algae TaxID=2584122 RepID=A0A5B7TXH2_9FLAO|nr:hypothetical protein [Aureibaculum algae]QCX39537.1 hypothetical protein FF125_14220 [Aureibaculum algae]